jgi:hypothetical protein
MSKSEELLSGKLDTCLADSLLKVAAGNKVITYPIYFFIKVRIIKLKYQLFTLIWS